MRRVPSGPRILLHSLVLLPQTFHVALIVVGRHQFILQRPKKFTEICQEFARLLQTLETKVSAPPIFRRSKKCGG